MCIGDPQNDKVQKNEMRLIDKAPQPTRFEKPEKKKTVNSEGNKRREEVNKWSCQTTMSHTQHRPRNPKHTLLIPINSPALSLSKPRKKKKAHKTAPEEKKKRLIRAYWLAKKKNGNGKQAMKYRTLNRKKHTHTHTKVVDGRE